MAYSKVKVKRRSLNKAELAYIEEHRMTKPVSEIAKNIDRAMNTIRSYYRQKGLDYYKKLDEDARQFIRDNYLYMTHKNMAAHIGVKAYTVSNYCIKYKLYKDVKSSKRDDKAAYYTRPEGIKEGSRDAYIHQIIKKIDV